MVKSSFTSSFHRLRLHQQLSPTITRLTISVKCSCVRLSTYTQTNLHNKLSTIIDDFPHTYQMHPFYSDLLLLLNVALYDKDHYKAALRQVDTSRNLIRKIAKDYVKLLKDGESLYRCNCLKVVAFGLVCIVLNRLAPSLVYLEQIRQLMASLPSVDTDTKTGTVLICGYPNVGKTCFMNKVITRADFVVDVFTKKSIFVGYTDYKNVPYQVIDTPGILNRHFRDHNMIEMCSITALAHLGAAVLFFVDISGSCGYTIAQQAGLFHNIKSMFKNNPLLIVCNKTDLMPMENISEEDMKMIEEMRAGAMKTMTTTIGASEEEAVLLKMSTLADEDVMFVKNVVCERLFDRIEAKDHLKRFHVAIPKPRDNIERLPCIPHAAIRRMKALLIQEH